MLLPLLFCLVMVLALGFYFARTLFFCFGFVFAWFVLLCYESWGDGVLSLGNSAKKAFEEEFLLKNERRWQKWHSPLLGTGKLDTLFPLI